MSGQVKPLRRKYHSPLRADQALQTRGRILDAAYRLFADGGYARTTITVVADTAGVSPETIYLTFGGKRGLLEGVIEMAIAPEADPSTQEDEGGCSCRTASASSRGNWLGALLALGLLGYRRRPRAHR